MSIMYKGVNIAPSGSGASGGVDFTVDDSLYLSTESVLGVKRPFLPLTKAEYDALSEEDKMDEILYLLTDVEGEDNGDASDSSNNYSNYIQGESVIGTWIDGRPIYRRTNIANMSLPDATVWRSSSFFAPSDVYYFMRMDVFMQIGSGSSMVFQKLNTMMRVSGVIANNYQIYVKGDGYATTSNQTAICILEYTKTTDQATREVL